MVRSHPLYPLSYRRTPGDCTACPAPTDRGRPASASQAARRRRSSSRSSAMSWKRCGTLAADEDRVAGSDIALVLADGHLGAPADDDVDLVLEMRRLRVGAAGRQSVVADAHRRHAQELVVQPASSDSRAVRSSSRVQASISDPPSSAPRGRGAGRRRATRRTPASTATRRARRGRSARAWPLRTACGSR